MIESLQGGTFNDFLNIFVLLQKGKNRGDDSDEEIRKPAAPAVVDSDDDEDAKGQASKKKLTGKQKKKQKKDSEFEEHLESLDKKGDEEGDSIEMFPVKSKGKQQQKKG